MSDTNTKTLKEPIDVIVFGGTGDLARRKLIPALLVIADTGYLPEGSRIIALGRKGYSKDKFISEIVVPSLSDGAIKGSFSETQINEFKKYFHYINADASDKNSSGWSELNDCLSLFPARVRAFYLAVSSDFFSPICNRLAEKKLITDKSRIVVEKPIGKSLSSSQELNESIGSFFKESQIFRIDHYLGKETVQNLMALRFANAMFESIWDSKHIDHVQITVAEDIGVKGRDGYYDRSGAMRDMVQNHILQLLCLVAMEPPSSFSADAVRDEKLKVLNALKVIDVNNINNTVRGQYTAAGDFSGYLDDIGKEESTRESFVAIKAELGNWRWAGIPFYLRTGKRMTNRISEIAIQFRAIPHNIFKAKAGHIVNNSLIIKLQPDEGIHLNIMIKDPKSKSLKFQQVPLDMTFAETLGSQQSNLPDAYERLLLDVIKDDQTLFMRRDEVEAAWKWTDPIIDAWENSEAPPYPYDSGSVGPLESLSLIHADNKKWRNLS